MARAWTNAAFDALDGLADVYYFVKDRRGRFVACNAAFLSLTSRRRTCAKNRPGTTAGA